MYIRERKRKKSPKKDFFVLLKRSCLYASEQCMYIRREEEKKCMRLLENVTILHREAKKNERAREREGEKEPCPYGC